MAILSKLMKVVSLSTKAAEKSAQRAPGHVTGHFAKNANGGTHWVREYTRNLKGTRSHVMPQGITPLNAVEKGRAKAARMTQSDYSAARAGLSAS